MNAMAAPISQTIGAALLACRRDRGWSQARLSAESGVPQTVISSIERAMHLNPPLQTVRLVCEALDAELIVDIRPAWLVGRSDQKDPAHAACVAATRRILERAGWMTASEVEIVTGRAHGFIDLIAFDPVTQRILVIEVKTEIRDVGGLERQVGWYLRAAPAAARRLGWQGRGVSGILVGLATAAVDAAVLANRDELAAAFPIRGRAVRAVLFGVAAIDRPALVLLDPLRRGTAGLMTLAADGRRTPAPYRDYAAFLRARPSPGRSAAAAAAATRTSRAAPGTSVPSSPRGAPSASSSRSPAGSGRG
jgi:transcriptional regulator with XRE-family HTH domain